jgi:hypothetical protein
MFKIYYQDPPNIAISLTEFANQMINIWYSTFRHNFFMPVVKPLSILFFVLLRSSIKIYSVLSFWNGKPSPVLWSSSPCPCYSTASMG